MRTFERTYTHDGKPVTLTFNFVEHSGNTYHIDVEYDGKREKFRMYYSEEEGQWKFNAQTIPEWLHEMELKLSDEIDREGNETL